MGVRGARAYAFAVLLALTACTGGAGAGAPSRSGPAAPSTAPTDATTTLRWALPEPAGITPPTAVDGAGLLIVDLLFDSLTEADARGSVRPALATSWRSQQNGRRWTFTLASDARFHDGVPVTADDVVRGWEAVVRAGLPHLHDVQGFADLRARTVERLDGVRAVDERTVQIELTRPNAAFPVVVAHPSLAPLPTSSSVPGFAEQPNGNGPFAMAEPWARGRFVRLQRTAAPSAPDGLREVVFQLADPVTSYIRFQQQRVDVSPVPGGAISEALDAYGPAGGRRGPGVHTSPVPALVYLGMDLDVPPWDDVDVRRALSLAIDRDALAATVSDGNIRPARSLTSPAMPGHESETCTSCTRDVEEAAAIFAEHGVDAVTLTLERTAQDAPLVDRLTDDLRQAGVELTVRGLPFADLLGELAAGEVPLYQFGWFTETPDLLAAVAPLVEGAPPEPGINVNYGGYAATEVDEILRRARVTQDPSLRARLVVEAERIAVGRDQALVPLYTTRERTVVSDRVNGFASTPFPGADLSAVTIR